MSPPVNSSPINSNHGQSQMSGKDIGVSGDVINYQEDRQGSSSQTNGHTYINNIITIPNGPPQVSPSPLPSPSDITGGRSPTEHLNYDRQPRLQKERPVQRSRSYITIPIPNDDVENNRQGKWCVQKVSKMVPTKRVAFVVGFISATVIVLIASAIVFSLAPIGPALGTKCMKNLTGIVEVDGKNSGNTTEETQKQDLRAFPLERNQPLDIPTVPEGTVIHLTLVQNLDGVNWVKWEPENTEKVTHLVLEGEFYVSEFSHFRKIFPNASTIISQPPHGSSDRLFCSSS